MHTKTFSVIETFAIFAVALVVADGVILSLNGLF